MSALGESFEVISFCFASLLWCKKVGGVCGVVGLLCGMVVPCGEGGKLCDGGLEQLCFVALQGIKAAVLVCKSVL